jgi:EpsG family
MMYYLLLLVVWVFALAEGVKRIEARRILLPLSFVCIWFFIGLRWETGTDWEVYITNYFMQNDLGFEKGYSLLSSAAYTLGFGYNSFLLLISFIPLLSLFVFLERKSRYIFVALLFFIANYMLGFLGGNRQSIAIGFVVLSALFIEEKKPVHFFVFICIAMMFHRSAVVFLPAYFMAEKRIPVIVKYCFLAGLVLLGKESAPVILKGLKSLLATAGMHESSVKLGLYLDQALYYGVTWSSIIKKILLLIVFDIFYQKMKVQDTHVTLYSNLYFFSIIIDAVFGPVNAAFLRAGTYYRIAEILLVAKLFEVIEHKHIRFIAYILLILYCLRQLYSGLAYYPDQFMPYKSLLF